MVAITRRRAELIYDSVERVLLTALGVGIVLRFLPTLSEHPLNALLVISECVAVAMIVLRGPAQKIDLSFAAIGVALVGTTGGLLVTPGGEPLVPTWLGASLMAVGFMLNIAAKLFLNRSFGIAAANRGVRRAGPYQLVRHPMYAGYMLTQGGFLLLNPTAWNLIVYLIAWTAQLARIRREEQVLGQDEAYQAYASKVRWRLAPGLY